MTGNETIVLIALLLFQGFLVLVGIFFKVYNDFKAGLLEMTKGEETNV
jgi:hypothetical protein